MLDSFLAVVFRIVAWRDKKKSWNGISKKVFRFFTSISALGFFFVGFVFEVSNGDDEGLDLFDFAYFSAFFGFVPFHKIFEIFFPNLGSEKNS